jgi:hypothetical protein
MNEPIITMLLPNNLLNVQKDQRVDTLKGGIIAISCILASQYPSKFSWCMNYTFIALTK